MIRRRTFVASASALLASSVLAPGILIAEEPASGWSTPRGGSFGQALRLLRERAGAAGLGEQAQKGSRAFEINENFSALLPDILDLIDALEDERPRAAPDKTGELDTLIDEATRLLGALSANERMARTYETLDPDERLIDTHTYEEYRDGYLELFDACAIRPQHQGTVNWYLSILTRPKNRSRYERVAQTLRIPWYFIGIIHALEGSYNFRAHLHNGDALTGRTVRVPRGRLISSTPPYTWEQSAADAMEMKNFHTAEDWSLARMLYCFERYNGFGYRGKGINTPYLWSFSNHHSKGKYTSDGQYDPNAISNQCGAAIMIRMLADRSVITLPNRV
jgi:lysozyme family protein